jgi:hypothetical protein
MASEIFHARLESADVPCGSLQIRRITGREAISSSLQSRIQTPSGIAIIMKDR